MSASENVKPPVGESFPDNRSVSDSSDSSNEEGWEDVEADEESQPVVGLFSEQVFPDARSMLKECKEKYNFDLLKIQKDLGMSHSVFAPVPSGNTTTVLTHHFVFNRPRFP